MDVVTSLHIVFTHNPFHVHHKHVIALLGDVYMHLTPYACVGRTPGAMFVLAETLLGNVCLTMVIVIMSGKIAAGHLNSERIPPLAIFF
jgi:hypothetical protein